MSYVECYECYSQLAVKSEDNPLSLTDAVHRQLSAASCSASAAAEIAKGVYAQISGAYAHALASCRDRTTVGLLPGAVPSVAGLQLLQHALIVRVIRFHGYRLLGVLEGDSVVSDSTVGGSAVVIPLGTALLHGTEDVECLLEHAVIDVAGCGAQVDRFLAVVLAGTLGAESIGTEELVPEFGEIFKVAIIGVGRTVFILPGLALTGGRAGRPSGALASGSGIRSGACGGIGMLSLVHDLLIGLLDEFEHLLCLILVRVVDIGVGMIFAAQLPVCFFDFVVGCVPGDSQDLIRI